MYFLQNWNLSPLSDRQDSDHSSSGTDINLYRDYTMVKPNYQGQEVVSEVVVNDLVKYDADEQGQIIDKQVLLSYRLYLRKYIIFY